MRRWFLSYHSADQALAERLRAALERKDAEACVFFAPSSLRAGGFWTRALADEIARADAFILLIGEKGVGGWQQLEYDEALDKRVKSPDFPVILVLLEGQTAPGLPFLRRLHWIITPDPSSEMDVARLIDAATGGGLRPGDLWRYTQPYRGLAAMTERDSDYFFGREKETVATLKALAEAQGKIPILLGNSGVGKSSLAQAGVLAALKRQALPENVGASSAWPRLFDKSRCWCYLTFKPGTEPLRALAEVFIDTWQLGATDPERVKQQRGWIELLRDGEAALGDLLDSTERRYKELDWIKPPAFLLYIDQGEELYVRADQRQRQRFSEVIAQGVADPRLHILMSMRSDFLGELQKDQPLFEVHRKLDVPPLREAELRRVVSRPAELLSVRFENPELVDIITKRTAEDSIKDVGALPLLSYTLDDMWRQMVKRNDGVLRLPAQSFEIGGVLVNRADVFLDAHRKFEDELRRIFILKLTVVREGEEPSRRRAPKSEFTEAEWQLVSQLADDPYRLVITATPEEPEKGEAYAEVAHEAVLRRWQKLRDWIAAEREFLAWKTGLESARCAWQGTPHDLKDSALLMGLALTKAQNWLAKRADNLSGPDKEFIESSIKREAFERSKQDRLRRERRRAVGLAVFGILAISVLALVGALWQDRETQRREVAVLTGVADRSIAEGAFERAMRAALQGLPAPLRVFGWSAPEVLRIPTRLSWSDPEMRRLEARLAAAAQLAPLRLQLVGHDGAVNSATFSPDGTRIVTASNDRTVWIWDALIGVKLFPLKGHDDEVRTVAFSVDGTRIVTASNDTTARIWDLRTQKEIAKFEHGGAVFSAAFNREGTRIVTASTDGFARIWDAEHPEIRTPLVKLDNGAKVNSAAFSPDGKRVVTASKDYKAWVWNAEKGEPIRPLEGHDNAVRMASFSHDGTRIVTASYDKTARVWDAETGSELVRIQGHGLAVRSAVFSLDDQKIVTTSDDRTIRIWDAHGIPSQLEIWDGKGTRMLRQLTGHGNGVVTADFSPDGKKIVSASEDFTARVWFAAPETYFVRQGNTTVLSAVFSPDGSRIAAASGKTAQVYNAADGQPLVPPVEHEGRIRSVVFADGGASIVTASEDHTVRIWDTATGEEKKTKRKVNCGAELLGVAVHESQIVAAAASGVICLWDNTTGKLRLRFNAHDDAIHGVAFSRDGKRIVTASEDKKVRVWDAKSGSKLLELEGSDPFWSAIFSPDGTRIVTGSWDRTARVWDAKCDAKGDANCDAKLTMEHPGLVFYAEFSPAGERVITASGSKDDRARIWDARTGALLADLKAHGAVRYASFSPDGTKVVTSSEDKTLRVWDVHWLATEHDERLARKVCSERLMGAAQRVSDHDIAADPALDGLIGKDVCAAHK